MQYERRDHNKRSRRKIESQRQTCSGSYSGWAITGGADQTVTLSPANAAGGPIPGVYGQREPPGEPLPEDQLRRIAAWIDGGALR